MLVQEMTLTLGLFSFGFSLFWRAWASHRWRPRKSVANIMAKIVDSEIMQIHYREPVLVIGREPLVAGTIVFRNNLRARKRYEKQLRWNSLTSRLRRFGRTGAK